MLLFSLIASTRMHFFTLDRSKDVLWGGSCHKGCYEKISNIEDLKYGWRRVLLKTRKHNQIRKGYVYANCKKFLICRSHVDFVRGNDHFALRHEGYPNFAGSGGSPFQIYRIVCPSEAKQYIDLGPVKQREWFTEYKKKQSQIRKIYQRREWRHSK